MDPVKWQKYLLLVEFGLTSVADLERQIRRTPWSSRWELFAEFNARLPAQALGEFTVIKLVTPMSVGQLKNIRLARRRDLADLRKAFASARSDVTEVWACRTPIGTNVLSVAGRLAISTKLEPFGHCIEQVWQCSPRMLEERGPDFRFPYARATRQEWGRSYHIDDIYLPKGWKRRGTVIRQQFAESMISLERSRSRLEELGGFLETSGITSYSFEYKIVAGHLSVIDWDTSNDWEILRNASKFGLLPVLQ